MKQYFTNLWSALLGRSPYLAKLEETKSSLEKALTELDKLKEMYDKALAAWEKCDRLVARYERQVEGLKTKSSSVRRKSN